MGYTTEHKGRRPTVLCLIQDNFLTQHVLELTRASRVLDIVHMKFDNLSKMLSTN